MNRAHDPRIGGDGVSQRPFSGLLGLIRGATLLLAILFAVVGAVQIGLAGFFLARGHPAWVVPREQPGDQWSFSVEGWLPLGAFGLIMIVLAWVTLRWLAFSKLPR